MGLREHYQRAFAGVLRFLRKLADKSRNRSPHSNDSQVAVDRPRVIREAEKALPGPVQSFPIHWLEIAEKELGVSEIPGSDHSKRIIEYHQATTLRSVADEVPWCAAFVNWVLREAGIKGTGLANARSFLDWGKTCEFTKGAVVVFKRGNTSWQGHVGFAVDQNLLAVKVLGGNQGNKVSYKWYLKKDLLGYRWPVGKA